MCTVQRMEITVRLSVTGFHHWPEAPKPVEYLAHPHRHMFGIAVTFEVNHDDRDLEFHLVQRAVRAATYRVGKVDSLGALQFGSMSCEAIAKGIFEHLKSILPHHSPSAIEVSEDGENSGKVYFR